MKLSAGSLTELPNAISNENFSYHVKSFRTQVDLFKQLAQSSWNDADAETKKEQKEDIKFFKQELEKILDAELSDFSKENFKKPDEHFDQRVGALTTFMYLFDKIIDLQKAVEKKNKIGLCALFDNNRDAIFDLLSTRYFYRVSEETMSDYLKMEPRLVACAELACVELVAIHKTVKLYQPKLKKKVLAIIEAEEKPKKKKSKKK